MRNPKINVIKVFKALSFQKRVKIFLLLLKNRNGLHLSLISEKLKMPIQTAGRHILKLRSAGIVTSKRYKNKMVYTVRPLAAEFDTDLVLFIKKYLK
ncbi:MAG: winged helix-turn-helix domain-containing protein [Elusimicrobiota bacterium]